MVKDWKEWMFLSENMSTLQNHKSDDFDQDFTAVFGLKDSTTWYQCELGDLFFFITLQYTLESFVEKRKAGYEYKPYKGGEIDDPSQGRAPEAWEMEVKFKELFKKDDKKLEVPHTSTVRVRKARIRLC